MLQFPSLQYTLAYVPANLPSKKMGNLIICAPKPAAIMKSIVTYFCDFAYKRVIIPIFRAISHWFDVCRICIYIILTK